MGGAGTIYPIVLAGGPSRLDEPRALARFGGRTAVEIAVANCAGLAPPLVVLGCDAARVRPFLPAPARVIVNRRWRSGQMSSLLAALKHVPRRADFLLYPVDYPLLTPDIVQALVSAFLACGARACAIAVPRFRRRTGHPVLFSAALRAEIEHAETAREVVYRDRRRVCFVDVATPAIWQDSDHLPQKASAHATPVLRGRPAGAQELLSELRAGRYLTRDEACSLIRCEDELLPDLLATAVNLKEQFKPGIVTYSRKVFLPLTNLCRDYCGYCTFRRDPGQPGAHTMTPDEVLAVARAGERLGCREALFSLGDKPEALFPEMRRELRRLGYRSTLGYLEAMCELVLRETTLLPHANPGLMSAAWLARLRHVSPSLGLMLESTSPALLRSAAHDRAPDKIPAQRLAVIAAAGRLQIPFTTGILIGIGESPEDRVDSLFAIAELHRRYGHVQEVIVQNFRRKPDIPMASTAEPDMGTMLRTVAVARLIMPDVNLQAPPNLSAPDYPPLLAAGINDWGGVSPLTPDFINPERPWPHLDELAQRTRAAGYQLRQRLPVYPEFLLHVARAGGLAADKTFAAADAEGYARAASNQEHTGKAVLNSTHPARVARQIA